jgi:hypothetical protein
MTSANDYPTPHPGDHRAHDRPYSCQIDFMSGKFLPLMKSLSEENSPSRGRLAPPADAGLVRRATIKAWT